MIHRFSVPARRLLAVLLPFLPAGSAIAGRLDFARDVAPILAGKCVSCHGEEKQKGGYRIDSLGGLLAGGESGDIPIIPGNADASLMFQLIISDDEDDRMPQDGDPLGPDELAAIKRWIEEGASSGGVSKEAPLAEVVVVDYPDAPGHYGASIPVTAIAWLGSGQRLASGGYHEVIVTDVESGEHVRRISGLPQRLYELFSNTSGDRLFYAGGQPGRSGEAGVIPLDPVGERTVLARSRDVLLAADLSTDGSLLAIGGADKAIRIVEPGSGGERLRMTQHSDWIMGLAFSPDASRLVSASRDGTARVFDVGSGELITTFRRHGAPVFCVEVLPDGETVVTGGGDGSVRVWNLESGDELKRVSGFGGAVQQVRLDGGFVLAAAEDGSTSFLRIDGWKRERRLSGLANGAGALAVDAGTGSVAVAGLDGRASFWKPGTTDEATLINPLP